MPDLPAAVYKYLTADRTASVLENLLIRFSQASVLNDATELKPPFKGVGTQEEVKKVILERLKLRFPDLMNQIETFNTFNHAQFDGASAVDGNISDSTFGQTLKSQPGRVSQVALKLSF